LLIVSNENCTFNFFLGFSTGVSPVTSAGGSMSDLVFDILRFGFSTRDAGCSTASGALGFCSSVVEGSVFAGVG
jgi:hypothetical protein